MQGGEYLSTDFLRNLWCDFDAWIRTEIAVAQDGPGGWLSDSVMAVVTDRDNGLFPLPHEIELNCDCPDWAVMCKHVAAVRIHLFRAETG